MNEVIGTHSQDGNLVHDRLSIPRQKIEKQAPTERVNNFDETYMSMTMDAAIVEAARCIDCPSAPCMDACPVHNDIPSALKMLENDDVCKDQPEVLPCHMMDCGHQIYTKAHALTYNQVFEVYGKGPAALAMDPYFVFGRHRSMRFYPVAGLSAAMQAKYPLKIKIFAGSAEMTNTSGKKTPLLVPGHEQVLMKGLLG